MCRCDSFMPLSASFLSLLDHFLIVTSFPKYALGGRGRWEVDRGFLGPALSLSNVTMSLCMSVSSSASEGARADEPLGPFLLGAV